MSNSSKPTFDNVALRCREGRCAALSVSPPFQTAYWPDLGAVTSYLGLANVTAATIEAPGVQARFLGALAGRLPGGEAFRPARIGFRPWVGQLRQREEFRQTCRVVIFLGACSREVALGALELAAGQVRRGGTVNVQLKQWDALTDWPEGRERLSEICTYLYQTRQLDSKLTLFSELVEVPCELWGFVYEHPRVRVAWLAAELAGCRGMDGFNKYRRSGAVLHNLAALAESGLWVRIVLPVSSSNVGVLPELVAALLEASRGGTIELEPAPLVWGTKTEAPGRAAGEACSEAPAVEDYVDSLLAIYRNARIPLRLVSPFSWVAERLDAQQPMLSSPAAAGAELAVLPNGDLYAGRWAVGLDRWRLGNVLWDPKSIRWERADAMTERFSNAMLPEECQECDWRYRCGGVDASVPLAQKSRRESGGTAESLFELYCAPRKRLFEEMLWGSVEAAANGRARPGRERIELREDGIEFSPLPGKTAEQPGRTP